MEIELLVNRSPGETRVALLEQGSPVEIYIERDAERSVVGNIYKGKVLRVLPGMDAAFVQIGLERAAFLHAGDVLPQVEDEVEEPAQPKSIRELVREGQELMVQVDKAPIGTKGARVTAYVSLPGRYVVYMPTVDRLGVSRRIEEEAERRRLKQMMASFVKPGEGGFIARTVSAGIEPAELERDMEFVRSLWRAVNERTHTSPTPSLLLEDLDLALRAVRDLFDHRVERLRVDDEAEAKRIRALVEEVAPDLADRVEVYRGEEQLFDAFGVERALARSLEREIPLPGGASIVIDEAEALTAIDVNTGGFVGSHDLEATLLETNLRAAREIAAQVRLRGLGGIIVIDFIDMQRAESREHVLRVFLEALARDRVKTNVLGMSELGVVEMTRKRVRASLGRVLLEPCPYCEGRGRIATPRTVCSSILRELRRTADRRPEGALVVTAMPEVAAALTSEAARELLALEAELGRAVVVEARGDLHREAFRVTVRPPASAN